MRRKKLGNEKIILNGVVIIGHEITAYSHSIIKIFKENMEKGIRDRYPELQCSMNSFHLFRDMK